MIEQLVFRELCESVRRHVHTGILTRRFSHTFAPRPRRSRNTYDTRAAAPLGHERRKFGARNTLSGDRQGGAAREACKSCQAESTRRSRFHDPYELTERASSGGTELEASSAGTELDALRAVRIELNASSAGGTEFKT